MKFIYSNLVIFLLAQVSFADAPEAVQSVLEVEADGKWQISVTLEHPDTGWEHYADAWRVEDADGNVIAERVLAHPHVEEQPFTRSLSGVDWPEDVELFLRAKCSRDGWNEDVVPLEVQDAS